MILPFAGIAIVSFRRVDRAQITRLVIIAAAAVATVLPLAVFLLAHPEFAIGRSRQVSVFATAQPLQEFLASTWKVLRMLVTTGDSNLRHNLAAESQLEPVVFALLVIGLLAVLLPHPWERLFGSSRRMFGSITPTFGRLVVVWWIAMILPSALTFEGQPHALRSIGMVVPTHILAGLGLLAVVKVARNGQVRIGGALLAVVLTIYVYLGVQTFSRYFFQLEAHPGYSGTFSLVRTQAALDLAERAGQGPNLVVIPAGSSGNTDWVIAQFRFFTNADGTVFDVIAEEQWDPGRAGSYRTIYLDSSMRQRYPASEFSEMTVIYY